MEMEEAGIHDPLFMQDNSGIHTAKLVRAFLKDHDWTIAKHPAYSPDLNPIEYVWAYMKQKLGKQYAHLLTMRGG